MAARGHPRTEVTLQLGQRPGQDLLTSRQKPSLAAPPELLQPSQAPALPEGGAWGWQTGAAASGAAAPRQKPRAQQPDTQRSEPRGNHGVPSPVPRLCQNCWAKHKQVLTLSFSF